ncbi:hypothetical protein ASPCADRAFT_5808 [Aspergillus carbonarius ITEM 5010]|uniref:Heterokaryon incompatibility domain-containing protein n=1 Tax=Aspergillus carbonarius (strain ITEM 5010) TaxID=602072 RepID=A0A1R3RLC1_ASPC5|nr:hypothetical protein ASPCADRAFT_5808 [Aspergillus carbonarius ITEM 5010]
MPRRIFGVYLAGLWTGRLLDQLLWKNYRQEKLFRHHKYVAPSFSWASVYGGLVRFEEPSEQHTERKARILDARAVPAFEDPMGPVLAGFIRMRLWIFPAIVKSFQGPTEHEYLQNIDGCIRREAIELNYSCASVQSYENDIFIDTEDDKETLVGQKVFIGEIMGTQRETFFLIMKPVAVRSGTFQRIGMGTFSVRQPSSLPTGDDRDCFSQSREHEIILI